MFAGVQSIVNEIRKHTDKMRISAPFKIVISGFQINAELENVFSIPYPPNVSGFLNSFKFFSLDIVTFVPAACIVDGGFNYHRRLVFNTVWPVVFCALFAVPIGIADIDPHHFPITKALRALQAKSRSDST